MAEYKYDFETLPGALRTNFAETSQHPLSAVQVEAADKLLTYFDQDDNVDYGCVLVLPAGTASEVVPLIPYILRSHSAMLLVTTPKAVKEYSTAATGPKAMLLKQGVMDADTFAHPKVGEVKTLFDIEDVQGRTDATDHDLTICNITRMFQPLSEVEDIGVADETTEAKLKRRKTYMIAPPAYLPVDNIDLLIVDSAVRLAGNVEFPDYLPELEYEVRNINPDVRIVYIASRCTTRNDAIRIVGFNQQPEDKAEGEIEQTPAANAEKRLLVCCDSLPSSRLKTKRPRVEPVVKPKDEEEKVEEKEDEEEEEIIDEVKSPQSTITHHSFF